MQDPVAKGATPCAHNQLARALASVSGKRKLGDKCGLSTQYLWR